MPSQVNYRSYCYEWGFQALPLGSTCPLGPAGGHDNARPQRGRDVGLGDKFLWSTSPQHPSTKDQHFQSKFQKTLLQHKFCGQINLGNHYILHLFRESHPSPIQHIYGSAVLRGEGKGSNPLFLKLILSQNSFLF